jgi:hypothetical protein
MNLVKLAFAFFFVLLLVGNVNAAGAPVNEDFGLVKSLCDDMVEMAKKGNKDGFVELADAALKLSEAMRRDNSMAIDKFRPKIRYAKKAVKSGDFSSAIGFIEEAKIYMRPTTAAWDGGS